jgi:hypothetical protein
MSDCATAPHSQLLVYRFGPEARFEGQLGGAFQRIESGGALRILDALFLASDPAAAGSLGELSDALSAAASAEPEPG